MGLRQTRAWRSEDWLLYTDEGEGAGEEAAEVDRGQVMPYQLLSPGTDAFAAPGQFCQSDFGHGTIGKVWLKQMRFSTSANILLKHSYL